VLRRFRGSIIQPGKFLYAASAQPGARPGLSIGGGWKPEHAIRDASHRGSTPSRGMKFIQPVVSYVATNLQSPLIRFPLLSGAAHVDIRFSGLRLVGRRGHLAVCKSRWQVLFGVGPFRQFRHCGFHR